MGLSRQLVVGITGIAFLGGARADPSYCYSIQSQDRKNYCLATAKKQQSYCYLSATHYPSTHYEAPSSAQVEIRRI